MNFSSPTPSPTTYYDYHHSLNRNEVVEIHLYALIFTVLGIAFVFFASSVIYMHFSSHEWRFDDAHKSHWDKEYVSMDDHIYSTTAASRKESDIENNKDDPEEGEEIEINLGENNSNKLLQLQNVDSKQRLNHDNSGFHLNPKSVSPPSSPFKLDVEDRGDISELHSAILYNGIENENENEESKIDQGSPLLSRNHSRSRSRSRSNSNHNNVIDESFNIDINIDNDNDTSSGTLRRIRTLSHLKTKKRRRPRR